MTKKIRIFRFLCLIALIGAIAVLCYEASLDGGASSQHSNAVGGVIAGAVNGVGGDQSKEVIPTSVTVNNKVYEVKVGDSLVLDTTVLPENATTKSLIYESSDETIAAIKNGKVSFKKVGEATITVKVEGYEEVKDSFTVTISSVIAVGISCSINADKEGDVYLLHAEEEYTIKTKFNPSNTTDKGLSYSLSTDEYFTVTKKGKLTGLIESGDVIIEITVTHSETVSQVLKVNVIERIPTPTPVPPSNPDDPENPDNPATPPAPSQPVYTKSIKIMKNGELVDLSSGIINVFQSDTLTVVLDSNITHKRIVLSSSDEDIIMVEGSTITIGEVGKDCVIKVSETYSGLSISFKVNVLNYYMFAPGFAEVTGLTYDEKKDVYKLVNGNTGKIKPLLVEGSTFTEVQFTSSDTSVLTVDDTGVISPKKIGTAIISIICDDGMSGTETVSIKVQVEAKPFIENMTEFFYTVRKSVGHYGAFLVLGICSTFVFLLYFKKRFWAISLPVNVGLGFGVALLTEYIQTFVPGRYGCMDDVWIDFAGFITSAVLISFIFITVAIVRVIKSKIKSKKLITE